MIPGMVGKNISLWMNNGGLPKNVSQYGSKPEEIFVCWEQVAELVGKSGSFGNYQATIAVQNGDLLEQIQVDVGSIVIATGLRAQPGQSCVR